MLPLNLKKNDTTLLAYRGIFFCIANFKLAATTFYIHTINTKQKRRFYTILRQELQTKVWQNTHQKL